MLDKYRVLPDGTEVRFATSTVAHGPMGGSRTLERWAWENRKNFISNVLKADPRLAVAAGVEHGNAIESIKGERDQPLYIEGVDGLFTTSEDVPLIITHKDCVPIFVFGVGDDETLIGILHAGWRGVLQGRILPKAIRRAREHHNVGPGNLRVFLGPAIQKCHFEVRDDVADMFARYYPDYISHGVGSGFADLHGILKAQARTAGVRRIGRSKECTYGTFDSKRGGRAYFSHRRDTHENRGTIVAEDRNFMISVIVRTKKMQRRSRHGEQRNDRGGVRQSGR